MGVKDYQILYEILEVGRNVLRSHISGSFDLARKGNIGNV